MSYKFIECTEPEASVRRIILNRPDKRNALCNPLRKELFDCLEKFDADPNVKAIIFQEMGHVSALVTIFPMITVKIYLTILLKQMDSGPVT